MSQIDISFYQDHLNLVSRSFSFCIQGLEPPLRRWVSSSYLICRILDTIEDSVWISKELQRASFNRFHNFFEMKFSEARINAWVEEFPSGVKSNEKKLLLDLGLVLTDFKQFPEDVQKIIKEMVMSMSRGMQHYANQRTEFRLKDIRDVNRYCFFVAGIVGEILAKLIARVEPCVDLNLKMINDSHHFGLFLQKINLLKDQHGDQVEGRFLIPNRDELKYSILENAQGAYDFIEAIPLRQPGFRKFCAWSLFLGLGSLPWLDAAFEARENGKIPKREAQFLLEHVEGVINKPEEIKELFDDYMSEYRKKYIRVASKEVQILEGVDNGQWVDQAYLGEANFKSLGMDIL